MKSAPPALLSAAALDAGADPHLQKGVHLRVLPSAGLGLPVAPLLVDRVVLGVPDRLGSDTSVVWTDEDGAVLSLPIDLSRVGTVYGSFAAVPGDPVLWAQVLIDDSGQQDPPTRPPVRPPVNFPGRLPELPPKAQPAFLRPRLPEELRVRLPNLRVRRGARVDALVSGPVGDSAAATALAEPYQVAAIGMYAVKVSGNGVVGGVRTVRLSRAVRGSKFEGWRRLALPEPAGERYAGIDDAFDVAMTRVVDSAPQRFGLHDIPESPDAWSCPPADPSDEKDRVETLWDARIRRLLDAALNDLSASPAQLLLPPEPMSGTATDVAAMRQPPLAGLLHSALDAGVGRLLGLVDRDDAPPAAPGEIVVYLVRGGFALHAADLDPKAYALLLPAVADPNSFPLPLPKRVLGGSEGPFVDLITGAAVLLGATAPTPARPFVLSVEDIAWLPAPPTIDRRHVAIGLGGLVPGAGVAVVRDTPTTVGLNSRLPETLGSSAPDRAMPIICGIPREQAGAPAATAAGQGEVHDRGAGAAPTDYRIAQLDWFGRWSPWTTASVGAGVRPAVPVPVLRADWVPPEVAGEPGALIVSAVQPADRDLPPGAYPLASLVVTAEVGGGPVTVTAPADQGSPAPGAEPVPLRVSVPVPGLAPAEVRTLRASAVWVEQPIGSTSRTSAGSPDQWATARDPRPPAALVLPNTLTYGSRPDTLGRSRVRLSWPAQAAPTGYRVYHADETTLRRRLESLTGAAADALRQALQPVDGDRPAAPDRAAAFRTAATLFGRDCFQLLTATPLTTPAPGTLTYEHELSASLDVLAFYRVVPLSGQLAEAPFADCTLLVRGIPNTRPPAQPLLSVAPAPGGAAQLSVVVPRGSTAPAALRVRRSRVSGADPLGMPVVASVAAPAWTAAHDTDPWTVTVSDAGTLPGVPAARLAPWTSYTWRVEVQGAPEPGTFGADAIPTAWSVPSAPASLLVTPGAVGTPQPGTATVGGTGADVRFAVDVALDGPPGTYVLEVFRRDPGSAARPIAAADPITLLQGDGSYLVHDTTVPPSGTTYLATVADRLGRRSSPAVVATVS